MIVALVQNYAVVSIQTIPDDGGLSYASLAEQYQAAIDITNTLPPPQVGWIFNGSGLVSNGVYTTLITKLAFRERFLTSELLAIYAAIPTYPLIQIILDNSAAATYVDLSSSVIQSAITYFESVGLLTPTRANIILTTPPSANEVYTP